MRIVITVFVLLVVLAGCSFETTEDRRRFGAAMAGASLELNDFVVELESRNQDRFMMQNSNNSTYWQEENARQNYFNSIKSW